MELLISKINAGYEVWHLEKAKGKLPVKAQVVFSYRRGILLSTKEDVMDLISQQLKDCESGQLSFNF